jgi:hypothetical protein
MQALRRRGMVLRHDRLARGRRGVDMMRESF